MQYQSKWIQISELLSGILLFVILSSCSITSDQIIHAMDENRFSALKLEKINPNLFLTESENGISPIEHAIEQQQIDNIIKILSQISDVNFNVQYYSQKYDDQKSWPIAYWAVGNNQNEIVELLIQKNLDTNFPASSTDLPLLSYALIHANDKIVEMIINAGADVNVGYDNSPPIVTSLRRENRFASNLLIENGAELDLLKNNLSNKSIYFFVLFHHKDELWIDIANAAYTAGVPINDDRSFTLHRASEEGNIEYIEWLLDHGAYPDQKNQLGDKPIDVIYLRRTNVDANGPPSTGTKEGYDQIWRLFWYSEDGEFSLP